MMKILAIASILSLGAVVQDPTALQDEGATQDQEAVPAQKTVALTLKDGRTVRAQVLGLEGDKAHLKVFVLGGEAKVKRPLSDFTPVSAFEIDFQATNPQTFEDYFALARRAVELDLLPLAGKQARAALDTLESDPAAEMKHAELSAWAADALEKVIAKAVVDRDLDEARKYMNILVTRFPEERTEEQLAAITQSVQGLDDQLQQESEDKAAQNLADMDRKKLEDRVAPIREQAQRGDKDLQAAFTESATTTKAIKSCESAIQNYKSAWAKAQKVAQDYADDDDIQKRVVEFGQKLEDNGIRAALHAASLLTTRSDYNGATRWANRVLAYDPDCQDAKDMLENIQQASASASSWRWGWAGGRRRR